MPNPQITQEMANLVAGRASFFFQVRQIQFEVQQLCAWSGDISPYFGEGVDILDQMIALKSRPFPWNTLIRLDFGVPYSNLLECDVLDLERIKAAYVAIWGNVDKPSIYPPVTWN